MGMEYLLSQLNEAASYKQAVHSQPFCKGESPMFRILLIGEAT